MSSLEDIHKNFWKDLIQTTKLNTRTYTILPSVIFLSCSFVLIYLQFHKCTSPFTKWRTRVYKDLLFHWTFFYISRIWLVFIKGCKWIQSYAEWFIEESSTGEEAYYNKLLTHICVFILVLTISLIPCLILSIRSFNRREMPNFLMWVAEDPWVRSEIGTSGHYLERPPRVEVIYPNQNIAFRSKRSSSVDTNIDVPKLSKNFRGCKSMMIVTPNKSEHERTD